LILDAQVDALLERFQEGYGHAIDFGENVNQVMRIAWVLDRIDDLWWDGKLEGGWLRRPLYLRLYARLFDWLKKCCSLP
jgi:hypothetical protein